MLFFFTSTSFGKVTNDKDFYISVHPEIVFNNKILNGYYIKINQTPIKSNSDSLIVESHYPDFGTIYYSHAGGFKNRKIITRFSPRKAYSVVVSCCMGFDIIENANEYMQLFKDYEKNYENIRHNFLDKTSINFELVSKNKPKNLFAIFSDAGSPPLAILLDNNFPSNCYRQSKGYLWNNSTTILIAKSELNTLKFDSIDKRKTESLWNYDDYKIL